MEFNPKESLKKGELATKVAMDKLLPFEKFISSMEQAPFSGGSKFKNGDTLLARITPCLENGKTAFVDGLKEGEVAFGSTEFIVLRSRKGVSDPQFIYYLAISSFFRNIAIKSMVGSSGRQRVQIGALKDIDIKVPSLEEQRRIASRLALLDSKIALNSRINDNLLKQIQALYKSWFVDYLPFGNIKPASWVETDIYALANIIYGAPFKSKLFNTDGVGLPIIRIRDLKEQQFVTYTTEVHPKGYLLQTGDIVIGMDGEFRPYIWGNEEGWLNQRVCVFENKRPNGKAFLYFTIKPLLHAIEKVQIATTVIHVGKKDFDALKITLPDEATLDNFDALTAPMMKIIASNSFENKKLAALRDSLLPKLMSGEVGNSEMLV